MGNEVQVVVDRKVFIGGIGGSLSPEKKEMSSGDGKKKADGHHHHHHHHPHPLPPQYGTFQGVPPYPPPQPVIGFPHPSPPPGAPPPSSYYAYQAIPVVEGRPVRERRLPCCGIGVGWLLFIIGFFLAGVPWYAGAIIILCSRIDHREKPGFVACTIAATLAAIATILGVTKGVHAG